MRVKGKERDREIEELMLNALYRAIIQSQEFHGIKSQTKVNQKMNEHLHQVVDIHIRCLFEDFYANKIRGITHTQTHICTNSEKNKSVIRGSEWAEC